MNESILKKIETNLKNEAKGLVSQVREIMCKHIDISKSDDTDAVQFCKKINSLRDDFILKEAYRLRIQMIKEKKDQKFHDWIDNYDKFICVRRDCNLHPKVVSYDDKNFEDDSYDDCKELVSDMKISLTFTIPDTKDLEPSLFTLYTILDDEYLNQGFINTLYIEEDLYFDISRFKNRYEMFQRIKRILNN